MATVKRRVSRKHEPYITRDLKWYMDWKVNGYIDYLDMIDPDRLYTLEYDTEVPTKEELLNGIDQHYVQTYNPHSRKDEKEKEEKDNNTNWFFEGEIVLQNEIEDEITPLTYVDEIEKRKKKRTDKNKRRKRKNTIRTFTRKTIKRTNSALC
jgi:hypothetical protein